MNDLHPVFVELRKILAAYAATLDVKRDNETELYIGTHYLQ
ncbi:hypothetical protein [Tautonia rosea]|nr:hypothetical protein [Tautonia rosea]